MTALATALIPVPSAAAAVTAPVVRQTLGEHHQAVRVNGLLVGRLGEAMVDGAGRVVRTLGPPDDCRGAVDATVRRWRSLRIGVLTEPLFGAPGCTATGDPVLRIVIAGPAARIVTEHGAIRVGRPLPAALRASAPRRGRADGRTVRSWPLTDPCTGRFRPGSTALRVRTFHGVVESATAWTGITDVITCEPDSGL